MFNLLSAIKNNLEAPNPIKTNRIFTHMPSQGMCYSAENNEPIGTCIRSSYLQVKNYPKSNPMSIYVKMTTEAGKLWESWLINQFKELGIYISHSTKLVDLENLFSGEIDIVHKNPLTDETELTECKQYDGSNYYAQLGICGSKNSKPQPKDSHLLQSFIYLLMCKNTEQNINYINLMYIDRSCKSYYNNFQFRISLLENSKGSYNPKVEYFDFEGNPVYYIDFRITDKLVYEKNKMLETFVEQEIIPPKDYDYSYTKDKIELLHKMKKISTTKYNKYKEDPEKNIIGDWQCVSENTSIQTSTGFKDIQHIEIGDYVYTRTGYEKVLKTINSGYKSVNKIRVFNNLDLTVTPDHKILTSFHKDHNTKKSKLLKNISFRDSEEVSKLKNACIVYKIDRTVIPLSLTDDELFVLAAFISEGSYKRQYKNNSDKIYTCNFTLNQNELHLAERIKKVALTLGATSVKFDNRTDHRPINKLEHKYLTVWVYGVNFIKWLKTYIKGNYSSDKIFLQNICYMQPDKQLILANYCCLFDGCVEFKAKGRNTSLNVVVTTCKNKALQLQTFYFRNNKIASIQYVPPNITNFNYEKEYLCKESYSVRHYLSKQSVGLIIDDFIFIRIKTIEMLENKVQCYDLSIENTHEFQTQTGLVHNCTYCGFGPNKDNFSTCFSLDG